MADALLKTLGLYIYIYRERKITSLKWASCTVSRALYTNNTSESWVAKRDAGRYHLEACMYMWKCAPLELAASGVVHGGRAQTGLAEDIT